MPAIRGLEKYLEREDLIEVRCLKELEGCTIGIDAFQWLRQSEFVKADALHSALGGTPLTLESLIRNELYKFHKCRIRPIFIFNGLRYLQNSRAPFSSSRSRKYAGKRKEAWKAMESGDIDTAAQTFSQISGYISLSMQNDAMDILSRYNASLLIQNKYRYQQWLQQQKSKPANLRDNTIAPKFEPLLPISYFRAPFYAASQLAYLESVEEMLHAVYGGCDLLMFGGETVILDINFSIGNYAVVHLDQILHELTSGNPYPFIDACLLSGFDACRQFEPLTMTRSRDRRHQSGEKPPIFEYALEKVLSCNGSGLNAVEVHYNPSTTGRSMTSATTPSSKFSQRATSPSWSGLIAPSSASTSGLTALQLPPARKPKKTVKAPSGKWNSLDEMLKSMLCENPETQSEQAQEDDVSDISSVKSMPIVRTVGTRAGGVHVVDGIIRGALNVNNSDPFNPTSNYRDLFISVKQQILRATVISFGGNQKRYTPFQWAQSMYDPHEKAILFGEDNTNNTADQNKEQKSIETSEEDGKDLEIATPPTFAVAANGELSNSASRIPPVFFRLLSLGVVSTFLPSAIFGGYLLDTTPLIDSQELEHAMSQLTPLRTKAIDVYRKSLATKEDKSVVLRRWFQPNRDTSLNYDSHYVLMWERSFAKSLHTILTSKASETGPKSALWCVTTPIRRLQSAAETEEASETERQLTTVSDVLMASCCGLFNALSYIQGGNDLSPYSKCIGRITQFPFSTVVALELIRNGDIHNKLMTMIDENGKDYQVGSLASRRFRLREYDDDFLTRRANLRLISRISSLISIVQFIKPCTPQPWMSKLSNDASAFNHVSTAYFRALRNLFDSVLTWVCAHCEITDNSTQFYSHLAFALNRLTGSEPCIGMGMIFEEFITHFGSVNWRNVLPQNRCASMSNYLSKIQKAFPLFVRIPHAILSCILFFEQISEYVSQLNEAGVLDASLKIMFVDASKYLDDCDILSTVDTLQQLAGIPASSSTVNAVPTQPTSAVTKEENVIDEDAQNVHKLANVVSTPVAQSQPKTVESEVIKDESEAKSAEKIDSVAVTSQQRQIIEEIIDID